MIIKKFSPAGIGYLYNIHSFLFIHSFSHSQMYPYCFILTLVISSGVVVRQVLCWHSCVLEPKQTVKAQKWGPISTLSDHPRELEVVQIVDKHSFTSQLSMWLLNSCNIKIAHSNKSMPSWQVVREKRMYFSAPSFVTMWSPG